MWLFLKYLLHLVLRVAIYIRFCRTAWSLGVAFERLTDIVKDLGSVLENLPDETKK